VSVTFRDRTAAGQALAAALETALPDLGPCTVLGIARGGVIVAAPVARALDAPLGVIVPRKVGAPDQPELALGAVAPGGLRYLDRALIARVGVGEDELAELVAAADHEAERRTSAYGATPDDLEGRVAVVVDDGIATGATAVVAARWARDRGASRVVLAAPVAPASVAAALHEAADDVVVLASPRPFVAVGRWYARFEQTSDEEVLAVLAAAR
jgi:putative phosphoribosyl transferase